MKKFTAVILICLIISAFAFGGCNDTKRNTDNETTTATDESSTVNADFGGYGVSNLGKQNITDLVPDAFAVIDFNTVTLKYLKGTDIQKLENEKKSEDAINDKTEMLKRFLRTVGISVMPKFTTDTNFHVNCTTNDGVKLTCGGISVSVTPKEAAINKNSTDAEIANFIKNDKYLNTLAAFSGVDTENTAVLREIQKSTDNENEVSYFYCFTVYTNAETAEERAFNAAAHSIKFSLFESESEKTKFDISFVGGNVWNDETVREITVSKENFEKAASQSAKEISDNENIASTKDANYQKNEINTANMRCRLVYSRTLKNGYCIPLFRFFYPCADGTVLQNDVPCVDISTLS